MDLQQLDIWQSLLQAVPVTCLVLLIAQFLGRLTFGPIMARRASTDQPASAFKQKRSRGKVGRVEKANTCAANWAHLHLANIIGINLLGCLAMVTCYLPITLRNIAFLCLGIIAAYWLFKEYGCSHVSLLPAKLSWKHGLLAISILFTLGPALAYPAGWDELTYHLELPRRWAMTGGLSVFADLPYSALPSLLEAIFTLTYSAEWLITPRLLVWLIWISGIFIFFDALQRVCRRSNAVVLTLALAASPVSLMISANCYVETLIWANLASILWLALHRSNQALEADQVQSDRQYDGWKAGLIGLLIGGSMAIKMTSVGLLCVPVLMAATRLRFDGRQALIAIAVALVVATPFYGRTWIATGNPVAPFYAQWFTSDPVWIQCSQYHHDLATGNFGIRGLMGLVVCPLGLAMANELYDGALGWQWLMMLFLLIVASVHALKVVHPQRSLVSLCVIAALLFYGLWFLTSQQARFAIPLLTMAVMAAGLGLESYREQTQHYWRLAIIGLTLLSAPWTHTVYYFDSWLCVLKVRSPLDYLRDGVSDSYADLVLTMHEQIPGDAKTISLFEHRLTYLPPGVEIATPLFQTKYFANPSAETHESFLAELAARGIQYVVLTTNPLGPDVSPQHIELQQRWFQNVDQSIANGQLKIIWKSDQHALAQVQPIPTQSNPKPKGASPG